MRDESLESNIKQTRHRQEIKAIREVQKKLGVPFQEARKFLAAFGEKVQAQRAQPEARRGVDPAQAPLPKFEIKEVTRNFQRKPLTLDIAGGAGGAAGRGGGAMRGANGIDGADGADGEQGIQGEPGVTGATGGGVPLGGTTGQVLVKLSNADLDTGWA